MYIILLLSKFSSGRKKKYQHWEKTTLFLTEPVSWIPDITVPQIIQPHDPKQVGITRSGPKIPDGSEGPGL